MSTKSFSRQEYVDRFLGKPETLTKSALERALDIRKFEIDLYWKRAAYFWTFIGATFVAFTAIRVGKVDDELVRTDLLVLLANIGVVFSVAWLCVNKGSKHWQENWERHVDMLEDEIQGPLYKVVMRTPLPKARWDRFVRLVTGPASISVSRVNLSSQSIYRLYMGVPLMSLPAGLRLAWEDMLALRCYVWRYVYCVHHVRGDV